MSNLNPEQQEAVNSIKGPVLVLAGAGSGKTRVLTQRIVHLINNVGIKPNRILAVTFTNKATNEMTERLHKALGLASSSVWISTFHSAGLRILRNHAQYLGYTNNFTIYDDDDSKSLIKDIIKRLKIDDKKFPASSFARAIDSAKNRGVMPEDFISARAFNSIISESMELQAEVYQIYQRELISADAMDFGDLLLNCWRVLEGNQNVLKLYQTMLEYILVDEFQDTNEIQYKIIKLLAAPQNNLFVVGDDDQSIYSFRGATVRNILEFDRDFPGAKVVALERNYRSSANVLSAAHAVIKKNSGRHKKQLWTEAAAGELLSQFIGMNEQEEADFIADKIRSELNAGASANDFAIFYRTNAQSRAIEEALIHKGIHYRIFGGLRFYERKEIKDILAYLKLLNNPKDNASFFRVINNPPRGIGAQSINKLTTLAQQKGVSLFEAAIIEAQSNQKIRVFTELISKLTAAKANLFLSELIYRVIEESEYGPRLRALTDPQSQSRLENLMELQGLARNFEKDKEDHLLCLKEFLDRVALAAEEANSQANPEENNSYVSLMTLHLAKGLEFPIVFLTGLEEGLLPHSRSLFNPEDLEEERRLCYVGITRAIKKLYITAAYTRSMFSNSMSSGYREPSRFISDIPNELWDESQESLQSQIYQEDGDDIYWDD